MGGRRGSSDCVVCRQSIQSVAVVVASDELHSSLTARAGNSVELISLVISDVFIYYALINTKSASYKNTKECPI